MSSPAEHRLAEVAEVLAWAAHEKAPTLGSTRLVCVDGPAGSGKTTLGGALHTACSGTGSARLLHMDDMYEGWSGLGNELSDRIERQLLGPLRVGRPGRYRRYDWDRETFAEWHDVHPVDTLVLEGVGSGGASYHSSITLLVWVEAPRDLRLVRGMLRDGEAYRPYWLRWMDDEDALFARERTRARADVVVDGTGENDPAVLFR